MKNLTTSVYTFENLIEGNFLYVDKTEFIWRLLEPAQGIYFLSRPRRFGKSLTISTLKAVFQNKRRLFKGLALDSKPYDWKEYPVIHIDLGNVPAGGAPALEESLSVTIERNAAGHGIKLSGSTAAMKFSELVDALSKKEKVVILIDEYDKPILNNIDSPNIQDILKTLKGFYSVIKSCESRERFVLLTGVSKFSKVSVFSDLNNLSDITMSEPFATMLGYTQAELENSFAEYLARVSETRKTPGPELLDRLKEWYNGYRFHQSAETVYNPVSIGKFFESEGEFKNYWFETGTPTFLLKLAKKQRFDFEEKLSTPVSELAFSSYEPDRVKPAALLVQTGYLTISKTVEIEGSLLYMLDFPNREVEAAFEAYLLDEYADVDKENVEFYIADMVRALKNKDVDGMMGKMQNFFRGIPYDIQIASEKYYQTIFYVIFRLIGLFIKAESRTSRGRIDAAALTDKYVYIFEFKLNKTADAAIKQIHDKEYYLKYKDPGREIILVGANFDSEKRTIDSWKTGRV